MAGVRVPVEFDGDFGKLMSGLERSLSGVSQNLTAAGGALTRGLTVPLIGLGTLAAREFAGFENSLTKIENHTSLTRGEIDRLSPAIRDVGTTAGLSGTEAADAFFFLQSGLGDSAKAMDALDAAAKGSAVGLGTTEDVSKALVSVMANYGEEAGSATDIMETFGAAAQASSLDADQMADGLRGVIPQAALAGVSLDDLAATMAVISPNFNSGSEAGTAMSAAMRAIVAPTVEAEKMLKAAGTSSEELSKVVGEKGLSGAMEFLGETFDGSQKDLTRMLGSSEAAAAVMGFLGADADTVARTFEDVEKKTFNLDEAFGNLADDAGFRVDRAIAQLRDNLLDLGQIVLPIAADGLELAASVAERLTGAFGNLSPTGQKVVVAIAGIAAGIGPALLVAGQFAGALGALAGTAGFAGVAQGALKFLGPIGLVVGALIAAWQSSEPFRQAVFDLGEVIQQVATDAMPQFVAIGETLTSEVLPVLATLFTTIATNVGTLLAAVLPLVGTLLEELTPVILTLVTDALPPLVEILGTVAEVLGTVLPPLISAFSTLLTEVLVPAIELLLPIVVAVFEEIGAKIEFISTVLQGLIDFVTGVFSGDWGKAWEGIQTIFGAFVTNIETTTNAWLTALEETLGISFEEQKTIVSESLTAIQENFTTQLEAIGSATATAFEAISTTISDHMTSSASFLREQWNIMDAESGGAMSRIARSVSNGMKSVGSVLASGWSRAVTTTGNALGRIGGAVGRAMVAIGTSVVRGMANAVSSLASGAGRMNSTISAGMSRVVSSAARAMGRLINAVSSGIGRAVGFLASFPGRAQGAVSGAAGALYGAGQQLIYGLINGIRSAAGAVASAAASVVQNAIAAAKGALGISSPSKVFAEIGLNTGQGMAQGLLGARGLVQDAANRSMVPDIGPVASGAQGAVRTASRGVAGPVVDTEERATVVVNEYGPRTDSAKRREVEWALRHPTRGRTFQTGALAVA